LSWIETAPLKLPEALGVKTTVIAQLAPAASCIPQVVLCWKLPLAEIAATWSMLVPELVSVRDKGWLVVFKSWMPKLRTVGDKVTIGDEPTLSPPLGPPPQPKKRPSAQNSRGKYFFIVLPL
jgi:hypothetical protein